MKYRITTTQIMESYGIIARLAAGEEIHTTLKALARERAIPSAALTGLGAVNDVTLAFFDPAKRVYREMRLIEDLEVATMTGNIAWAGDEPIIHLHGVVSRADCTTAAGHIMRGIVSVTLEVMIRVDSMKMGRSHDAGFGLNLLDLD
jgi:predicted DNA-binding protein with PD1-like motif